jgi:hypothetical protein
MKEPVLVFLAFVAVITGLFLMLHAVESYYEYEFSRWIVAISGSVLFAGGVTYFWKHSKFYRR